MWEIVRSISEPIAFWLIIFALVQLISRTRWYQAHRDWFDDVAD